MTVRRVTGIETEYGISVPGDPGANPMLLSAQVVNAYASPATGSMRSSLTGGSRARWDYEDEAPLRDARGYEIDRAKAHPSQLTDAPGRSPGTRRAAPNASDVVTAETEDPTMANVILTNGARFYVDHAHPEYSSPEILTPRDAVLWDRAGELILLEALRRVAATPGLTPVTIYKNNTDGKGASYGTHENYLMNRSTSFTDVVRHLTPSSSPGRCSPGPVGWGSGRTPPGPGSRSASARTSSRSRWGWRPP